MNKKGAKPIKRKLFNAYFVSTLSITLVLFLIGLLSLLVFNARYLNNYIRENIGLTLVLNEDVREVDLLKLQKLLSAQDEVKTATYVNAESAASILKQELGEDFIGFLGYNPLHASIDVKLFAQHTHNDSLAKLEQKYLSYSNVEEVYYQRNLVNIINENSNKISLIVLGLGIVMLLIFFALINNTIRLSIYSKRFIINTMQLVGATRSFIRWPFITKSMIHGLLGAVLANFLLLLLFFSYNNQFNEIINIDNNNIILIVFAIVFVTGICISWLSTAMAVNKFLRLQYDELFN
ncbi:MAG: permease-like cell division protein FtsX [Prolixibacteraceae bacterium]|jgi:cell division transport system permease protein|nr:permease-like cell division protein FtsX [Prolixibacteraceae bacterium]